MVQYYDDEVPAVRAAEEAAVLRALPPGHRIEELNGVDVGCGDRLVHPAIVGIDVHRGEWAMDEAGPVSCVSRAQFRAWADDLPFRPSSVDFIVALHVLEHEPDPVATVLHWLDVVKPGGGVGIVVSDWRYTWNARHDRHPWSHRWNPTPPLLRRMHERHWAHLAALEHVDTYPFRISFDVVLRKHGRFAAFDPAARAARPTGHQLHEAHAFPHEEAA